MRKIFYKCFVNNKVINFIGNPVLSMVVPPLLVLYYGTLDIWGEDWLWVKDKKEIHELVFSVLAGLTILILFLKGVSESVRGAVTKKYNSLVEGLIQLFSSVVKKKRDRFFNKAKNLSPTGDAFKIITQPKDQLEYLLDQVKSYISHGFEIDQKNIGITIIQGDEHTQTWWYAIKNDTQKQHTRAKELMSNSSTAKHALDSGDSIYISDIRKGAKDGCFYNSERSQKTDIGSIFCKPVRVGIKDKEYVYVFTVAVFGQHLCVPYDEEESRACEMILDEIADRVELELYLFSIRQYRYSGGT